uniref:ATP synthase complex subunit 8 n=1 Tax=Macrocheles glaber TaxID=99226 RepID=A0A6B9WEP2_9ACAR|nr:ATP synthase F0 subunit 8 [Macrocheles glaber]QHQ98512.1 ATP synthase subunit 8 [Macrocheles glaber]
MPQMYPMNWILLFMTSLMSLYIMYTLLYFNFLPKSKFNTNKTQNLNKNFNYVFKW